MDVFARKSRAMIAETSGSHRGRREYRGNTRIALIVLLLAPLSACNGAPPATAPAAPTVDVKIKDKHFALEIAATAQQRETGLMHRQSMPAGHGMIFVFTQPHVLSFWMKNTLIPLDIIYVDGHGKVIDILPLAPKDETAVESSGPAQYAIELNRGAAAAADLHVGDVIELPKTLPAAEEDQ